MKAKIKVTFDMSFDDVTGECKSLVDFSLPGHPDVSCPDSLKLILAGEIKMLCGAMEAAGPRIFSDNI